MVRAVDTRAPSERQRDLAVQVLRAVVAGEPVEMLAVRLATGVLDAARGTEAARVALVAIGEVVTHLPKDAPGADAIAHLVEEALAKVDPQCAVRATLEPA